jgi:competence ComEA-like helix-hairpin-helix protein
VDRLQKILTGFFQLEIFWIDKKTMRFELSQPGEGQRRDGRITVILLLIFLLLLFLVEHQKIVCNNINKPIYMYLSVTIDKLLYIEQNEKFTHIPASVPLVYYPLLFFPVPINSADQELLMTIKGIGPSLAETIVVHRQKNGFISNISDLQTIPGVGRKRAISLATELVFDTAK